MNLTLDNFFKLDNTNLPNLILIHANIEYNAAITYCTDFFKNKISSANSTTQTDRQDQIKTYRFDVERYFNFNYVEDLLQSPSLFDETNYIELNFKTRPKEDHQQWFSKLYKYLSSKNRLVIICDLLNKNELNSSWIEEINSSNGGVMMLNGLITTTLLTHILQQNELSIEQDALKILLQQNESNITQLLQEINNLVIYYPSGTKLSIVDIQKNTSNNAKYDIYQLSNAYLAGDLKSSLLILDNVYNKTEDAILIAWIMNEDIRKLLKIKSKLRTNNNMNQCIREVGVWGSSLEHFPTANKRLSYKILTEILKMLSQLDCVIKGIVDGDAKNQIKQIIIKITSNKQ